MTLIEFPLFVINFGPLRFENI